MFQYRILAFQAGKQFPNLLCYSTTLQLLIFPSLLKKFHLLKGRGREKQVGGETELCLLGYSPNAHNSHRQELHHPDLPRGRNQVPELSSVGSHAHQEQAGLKQRQDLIPVTSVCHASVPGSSLTYCTTMPSPPHPQLLFLICKCCYLSHLPQLEKYWCHHIYIHSSIMF